MVTAKKAAAKALVDGKPIKTASLKAEPKTTASDEVPEAQPTKAAASKAAEKQFAKADSAGEPKRDKGEVAAEEVRARGAALGY